MPVASLFNVPTNEHQRNIWTFKNFTAHEAAIQAVFRLSGTMLPIYPLDPVPDIDIADWDNRHQAMHDTMNQVLGTAGSDFTGLDFRDVRKLEGAIYIHAVEHLQWANLLGI